MKDTFTRVFEQFSWEELKTSIASKTDRDVELALTKSGGRNLHDFMALVSPAAAPYLESMAKLSYSLTRKRFGNTIQLYAPLYVSNECQNICTYCGFSYDHKLKRKTLSDIEFGEELLALKKLGFDHLLLVSGEANKTVGVDYFKNVLQLSRNTFSHLSLEVQPLDQPEYEELIAEGLDAVLVYQETYHRKNYRIHHPKGKKSNFVYRLETPDRLGAAGIDKIGLGALLGLEDWRVDSTFTALHLTYLRKKYWKTSYSISFPRLRPAEGVTHGPSDVGERELTQLICAFRIFDEDLELSLSTRESQYYRDNVVTLGPTTMSAGSKTEPGGYTNPKRALEQFSTSDERSPSQVIKMLERKGLEPVWKNWDSALSVAI